MMGFDEKRHSYYRFFNGRGLDVGPFDLPFVGPEYASKNGLRIDSVDHFSPERLRELFPELKDFDAKPPTYVHDIGTKGFGFNHKKYDFIIMSHVLEHVMNPFGLFVNAYKKLSQGGVLYIGVPDERYSFDKGRRLVSFDKLMEIYRNNVTYVPDETIIEFMTWPEVIKFHSGLKRTTFNNQKVPSKKDIELERLRSIHVHVWNDQTFFEHLEKLIKQLSIKVGLLDLAVWENNGYENIIVLKKVKRVQHDITADLRQLFEDRSNGKKYW